MKKILGSFVVITVLLVACAKNQVTGRKQLRLLPEKELQSMATQQYQQFLAQNKIVSATVNKDAEMVRRVGTRIAYAITKYYEQQGKSAVLDGYTWEFNLVDNKEVNAWCMPGGKVVVYTGLLPVTQNEAALAVVMGHEIAHAIALHGNERMSLGVVQQLGGVALSVALANKPAETQNLFLNAYGIGSTVGGTLPFSRKQELEADQFGLRFAAMAGYNPQEAVAFWQRMAKASSGQKPPEILSTHPSDETRIAKMEQYVKEAMPYYKPVGK
ncbi:peptidase M48-like protein [Lacibacter cauensis]|uniref:Peptidase M48-like protein n=1 Tax=Lacibacter cauensis TaxID=510947 RepID=A0A562SUS0_9BACT|nr:M48 family metallopeptidase [Lacibacter cauensis]TWI84933.1 peptidase M48-like protein [Lacibacter cauensis]